MWQVIFRKNPDGTLEKWTMNGDIKSKEEAELKVKMLSEKHGWEFVIKEV